MSDPLVEAVRESLEEIKSVCDEMNEKSKLKAKVGTPEWWFQVQVIETQAREALGKLQALTDREAQGEEAIECVITDPLEIEVKSITHVVPVGWVLSSRENEIIFSKPREWL